MQGHNSESVHRPLLGSEWGARAALSHITWLPSPHSASFPATSLLHSRLKTNVSATVYHHTFRPPKLVFSAWNALSFPAWQTPTHPSKPNVHDSSSGRSQDRTNLSLFFFCIRTRLERPTIPDPHTAGIWLAQGSAPLPPPHSLKPQHRLSPDCLQALDSRLAWPCSPRHHGAGRPGSHGMPVFLCAWGVRGVEGSGHGRVTGSSGPAPLPETGPWASQARAGQ